MTTSTLYHLTFSVMCSVLAFPRWVLHNYGYKEIPIYKFYCKGEENYMQCQAVNIE